MEIQHRFVNSGPPSRRSIAVLALLLALVAGDALWAQNPAYTFANRIGSSEYDNGNDIAIDGNGNMYVTGRFRGTVDFDPGAGTANLTQRNTLNDIFIASYDASGGYRWAFNVGSTTGTAGDNTGLSIAVDGSGNVVVSGLFQGTMDFNPGTGSAILTSSGWSTFVARYDSAGGYLWAFNLGTYSNRNDVAIDASGNVVVVGTFSGTFDFNPGTGTANLTTTTGKGKNASSPLGMYVAKYSPSGAYQWAFKISNQYQVLCSAVDIDGNGNIYVTGTFGEFASTVDFNPGTGTANLTGYATFVAKYSSAGAYVWAFKIGATSPTSQRIAVDDSGNVALTGTFTSTIDVDPGSGTTNLVARGTNNSNVFVARYNASGSYLWAFTPSLGYGNGVHIDGSGNIYVIGSFSGTNDFDPGSGTVSLPTDATYNAGGFAASYSSTGAYRSAFSIPGPVNVRGIALSGSADIYLTGDFGAGNAVITADFDPSEETANLTSAGKNDIFIAKYTESTSAKRAVGLNEQVGSNDVAALVAPNPFTSDFTFHFGDNSAPARIEIIDMLGRVVETTDVDGVTQVTLGAELPAGTYLVRATQGTTIRQTMVRKAP